MRVARLWRRLLLRLDFHLKRLLLPRQDSNWVVIRNISASFVFVSQYAFQILLLNQLGQELCRDQPNRLVIQMHRRDRWNIMPPLVGKTQQFQKISILGFQQLSFLISFFMIDLIGPHLEVDWNHFKHENYRFFKSFLHSLYNCSFSIFIHKSSLLIHNPMFFKSVLQVFHTSSYYSHSSLFMAQKIFWVLSFGKCYAAKKWCTVISEARPVKSIYSCSLLQFYNLSHRLYPELKQNWNNHSRSNSLLKSRCSYRLSVGWVLRRLLLEQGWKGNSSASSHVWISLCCRTK